MAYDPNKPDGSTGDGSSFAQETRDQLADVKAIADAKSDSGHNHDAAYSLLAHVHASVDLSDFPAALVALKMAKVNAGGTAWELIDVPGGGANLSYSRTSTTVKVNSDSGTDATLPGASGTQAGVMVAADKSKLDGISSGADVAEAAGAVMDGDFSVDGIMVRTAAGAYASRTLTAGVNMAITNGDGDAGNPTIKTNFEIRSTEPNTTEKNAASNGHVWLIY